MKLTLTPPPTAASAGAEAAESSNSNSNSNSNTRSRLTKACRQCHERKVRCDAPVVGLPCSRCVQKGHGGACVQMTRQPRRKNHAASPMFAFRNGLRAKAVTVPAAVPAAVPAVPIQTVPIPAVSVPDTDAGETVVGSAVSSPDKTSDLVEYHSSLNYLRILGEAVDGGGSSSNNNNNNSSSSRVAPTAPVFSSERLPELAGLDDADREYLARKGVFQFPPPHLLDAFLAAYFARSYPPNPILNRAEFMQAYAAGPCSTFLLHAVLAVSALYVPMATLRACGFADRATAQAAFFSKATVLYDLGCERSTLRSLQGSLLLSSAIFSRSCDKDFRYWFFNAVRIALKMGLHRREIADNMDAATYKVCKRIWWVLYSRDVILSYVGLQNMRILTNDICDTPPLTEDDWDDEAAVPGTVPLPPITRQEKLFQIANAELAVIASRCLSACRSVSAAAAAAAADPDELVRAFVSWRQDLPQALKDQADDNDDGPPWIAVLLASGYRFECIVCRQLRQLSLHARPPDRALHAWARRRLAAALFELNTLIQRATARGMLGRLTLTFKNCVPTVLALYIEVALDETESPLARALARVRIGEGMLLLQQLQEYPTMQRALAAFGWVLSQKDLRPDPAAGTAEDLPPPPPPPPVPAPVSPPASHTQTEAETQPPETQPPLTLALATQPPAQPPSYWQQLSQLPQPPSQPHLHPQPPPPHHLPFADPLDPDAVPSATLGESGQWFEDFLGFDFLDNLELMT